MERMTVLFSDDDVAAAVDAPLTVAAMRDALLAAHAGRLIAPPRASAPLGGGRMVLTAGHLTGQWYGFRSYDTFGHPESGQLVVLHDAATGAVRAIAVGEELGSRRTGGLGGVAVDALARADAATIGVVGSGRQAWTQVWAAAAVRPLREVTVFSRSAARRDAFAARVRAELGVPARAVGSAAAAVRDRDVVVLATTSTVPVLDAADLAPGTHVNTVGFKQVDRHEFGPDLLDAADLLVTDSPGQAAAYVPPMLAAVEPYAGRLRDLGAVLAGAAPGRTTADQISVFCSTGLAGTEVFLLDRLARVAVSAR
ncbi:ornithine cyclodeaminase/mu-crystallin [Micromonospora sp. L5]|uniref:Ornithine cyclodeaminase family protein n=2 Tax=Micromonosporaceae TaxID=28056 RepID=A0A3M9KUU8_9ACTN|nr:ornithine cyclodeaminase/mu-crystallin [Micromonospora aurantiaca ATCC 27029]ADU07294.1 ornithine cyclodeaminase/mu-crystallin [Micromonospora sp. L5]AXH91199.1 ornithine cyclodeaminase family protein [Micromonospora aurantiaca]RNI04801.1 ornithine cyclodeaminase family protein [Micromonospora aurantiaca]